MNHPQVASVDHLFDLGNTPWLTSLIDYTIDAWQRSVLYADVMRERGNQYQAHLREKAPNVLDFPCELVMYGADLPRPVNYGLVRILPPEGTVPDPAKRPFVVVDPRAGHGPGIGGFKPDSEIGAALQAGHPCYFVGFLPDPVPGQTVEDVMRAEAAFLRRVIELHPQSMGKPAVIGNCQAGWQILMTAAVWPELFGPIIVAGAPLSYWAGETPMRYAGGLLGGSWATAATSDVGAGRFDGAWLVQNFENLDPANTLWKKQYNLYAKVDTEAPRYLGFEKYWGGHVFLNDVEMQYIVDNLFIGNRLSTAELVTSDGVRIDLRNIRSPIVVFCSYGDNITPPPQALGWITDLYRDDQDIIGYDQTIVYATHDSIGHLGIFVSGSVGRKEHREFTNNIDLIDLLPAGLYQAVVEDKDPALPHGELTNSEFLMSIHRRSIDDVRDIVQPDMESDRHFDAARTLSDINLSVYRHFMQPWVRAFSTPESARWMQALQPLRIGYEWWSDEHPLAPMLATLAGQVREHRRPATPDNPLLQAQAMMSQAIVQALDSFRDHRDEIYGLLFHSLYGSPWLQALAGQGTDEHASPRPHPGDSPEHLAFLAHEMEHLHAQVSEGGLAEAAIRALLFVLRARGEGDERQFRYALRLRHEHDARTVDMAAFRQLLRGQARLLRHDPDACIQAIPTLLARAEPEKIRQTAAALEQVITLGGAPTDEEKASLRRMLDLFEQAAGSSG
ncbi:DUF3141 domain-containing protein [Dyella sp. C9]|uniref:DUF3141 domain-containing protein n=1 Tax=Dyella sp. C9 TaxID=2202154 RepID=UPI000DEEC2BE|nr:DUF3141 domain-containing protein [Dyella sp. C9]